MEFWHNIIIEKSFELLKSLSKEIRFILIGGWGVFFYTHSLKSKDIDIIIEFEELSKLKEKYNVSKNERLKKYEVKIDEVDVDIYIPYYSNPGIPAEEIIKYLNQIEGFTIPLPEILLILKQRAFSERRGSVKGEKDKIDILSLLKESPLDYKFYKDLLKQYKLEKFKTDLVELLSYTSEAKELGLSRHAFTILKRSVMREL